VLLVVLCTGEDEILRETVRVAANKDKLKRKESKEQALTAEATRWQVQ
jgi:hypothetical protein